jgi:branched-chain amino acid transport system substrate-binding protein
VGLPPGEGEALPLEISEVRIGYFGPDDPDDALSGDLWLAASMAVEELNRENGYRGLPYRLIAGWSNDPWGSGVKLVTQMVYEDRVWALIAPVDGPSIHLAEQVVAKARLSLLNPGSSDRTANLANVPWIFSGLPGEDLQVPILFDTLIEKKGERTFVLISATDHDSRVLTTEFERYISTRGTSPGLHLKYDPEESRSLQALENISEDEVGAVVIFAGPRESADIVKIIRTRFRSPILGGPSMGRSLFLKLADASLKRVFFPLLGQAKPGDPFIEKFRERYHRTPDFAAIQTYDLMRLLGQAIEDAGLERERIRDAIRNLAPWDGINGIIDWDQFGQNKRKVRLATLENGEVRVLPRAAILKD